MAVVRWRLHDPVANDYYTFPRNPFRMSSVFARHQTTSGVSSPATGTTVRALRPPSKPKDFVFEGKYQTQAFYDAILDWTTRDNPIELRDHYMRTFEVMFMAWDPDESRARVDARWRGGYTVRGLLLRRIS